ncbi:MAG: hypothetical protein Q7U36_00455 [bacterium]|nr:hypothetical protein [bacterium]
MKKMTMIVLAMVVFFGFNICVTQAEQQRMYFQLESGQEVQKFVNFSFNASWGCQTYRFISGDPNFGNKPYWEEIPPGSYSGPGMGLYRFIAEGSKGEVNISGETTMLSGYQDIRDLQDISLFVKDSWVPFNLGFLPMCKDGALLYTYSWVNPGWGTSICHKQADEYTTIFKKLVGVVIFSSAGFLEKVVLANSNTINDMWINTGEIALLIHYEGNNWPAENKIFSMAVKNINQNIKNSSN